MCKCHTIRSKQLRDFIESLGVDKRWEQMGLLQDIRNKNRSALYEGRMGEESLMKRVRALEAING